MTPTATPTGAPGCTDLWPITKVFSYGKGQSPLNNGKVIHYITGHIVNPDAIGQTAHRIPVCRGTSVDAVVWDINGATATNTSDGSLSCNASGCSGVVNVVEKYKSVSQDGKDTDRMTLLPN